MKKKVERTDNDVSSGKTFRTTIDSTTCALVDPGGLGGTAGANFSTLELCPTLKVGATGLNRGSL